MTTNANLSASEEIRLGVANACLMMPAKSEDRRDAINELYHRQDREKELVSEAKDQADVAGQMKRLHKVHGVAKATTQIMKILDKIEKPGDRAAVITQVGLLAKDVGYVDKDLVTLAQEAEATAGQQADDQGSVFDKTSEGKRRGGKAAQSKPVEQKAAAPEPAPTPGIPLAEAQAQLEAYLKANPPKRGAKPAERKRLEAQVADAQAAEKAVDEKPASEAAAETAAAPETDGEAAGDDPALAEKPEAEPGQVSREMKQGVAESEAHLRDQVTRSQNGKGEAAADRTPANDADDGQPPPAPRRGSPLKGATGQGSYTLN